MKEDLSLHLILCRAWKQLLAKNVCVQAQSVELVDETSGFWPHKAARSVQMGRYLLPEVQEM